MPGYFGIAPTPPRTGGLLGAILSRLGGAIDLGGILGGTGRIFLITDPSATVDLGGQDEAWGRGVIAPIRRVFGEPESQLGRARLIPFLVRFDVHSPGGSYNPHVTLEAAHTEAFRLLHGWTPGPLAHARMNLPVWRHADPQSLPLWDNETGVWFTSAEYRGWLWPALED